MINLDYEESNMCKFNFCPYYDFENDKCSRNICIKVEKNNGKEICR